MTHMHVPWLFHNLMIDKGKWSLEIRKILDHCKTEESMLLLSKKKKKTPQKTCFNLKQIKFFIMF